MADIKKRGLDSLISQNSHLGAEINRAEGRFTKKWRSDIDKIEQEKGKDM